MSRKLTPRRQPDAYSAGPARRPVATVVVKAKNLARRTIGAPTQNPRRSR
jgi:hypothetical protein